MKSRVDVLVPFSSPFQYRFLVPRHNSTQIDELAADSLVLFSTITRAAQHLELRAIANHGHISSLANNLGWKHGKWGKGGNGNISA